MNIKADEGWQNIFVGKRLLYSIFGRYDLVCMLLLLVCNMMLYLK